MTADIADSAGDWFWGHSAGEKKDGGLISNPFKDYGTYEEGRQGAFYKAIGVDSQIKDEKEDKEKKEKKVDEKEHKKDKEKEEKKVDKEEKSDGNKKVEKKVDEETSDKKKEEKKVADGSGAPSPDNTLDTLNVTNLYLQDKALSDLLQSGRNPEKEAYRAIVESSGNDKDSGRGGESKDKKGKQNEMVIRVVVEGKVEGMTAENQGTIAGAIAGTFDSAVAGITNFITGDGYNLSEDQSRG